MSARVLVVAGHDPSYGGPLGGAGVDADREAIEAAGARALCVVSAWTDQDGRRVRGVRPRAPAEWLAEAHAHLDAHFDTPVQALKSGLLADGAAVHALAALVDRLRTRDPALPIVVDPVLAASGGEPFLDDAGIEALLAMLLPRGVILTPNLPEAARLTGRALADLQRARPARLDAARTLLARGAAAVILKGGHATDAPATDLVLARDAAPEWIEHPRLDGARLHGSGCRYASTLAAHLALGAPLVRAARAASRTLAARLAAAPRNGTPAAP